MPRNVPVAVQQELRQHLQELVNMKVLSPVKEPTKWINSMVIVKKLNKLRICLDLKDLNKAIKRPHYPIPTIDDILPQLSKAKVFSVLDAKDGFWQVKLDEPSSYLTTFWTPFGRYRWLCMPFGISSALEEFQRRQHEITEGLQEVYVIADDILVYGCGNTEAEAIVDHDKNLFNLLTRAREKNLEFNKSKLKLKQKLVSYMGHLLTPEGVKADPAKVKAIVDMPVPHDVTSVQLLLGYVNYLSRFLPRLSHI